MSIPKLFWVRLKNLNLTKNLRTLKTNFEKADGLGISQNLSLHLTEFCFNSKRRDSATILDFWTWIWFSITKCRWEEICTTNIRWFYMLDDLIDIESDQEKAQQLKNCQVSLQKYPLVVHKPDELRVLQHFKNDIVDYIKICPWTILFCSKDFFSCRRSES